MSTNVQGSSSNVQDRVHLKHTMKENDREQDLTAENATKEIAKDRPRPRAGKEAR